MAANAGAERGLTLLVGRLEASGHKVHSGLERTGREGTRELMRAMVRRVEVDGDHLDVASRIPPPSQPGGDGGPRARHRPHPSVAGTIVEVVMEAASGTAPRERDTTPRSSTAAPCRPRAWPS